MSEIAVILLLALIFLGPKKLPELASGLGKMIREVRKATAGIKNEIQLDDAIRKPLEELREATMLPPEELVRRDLVRKQQEEYEREQRETALREAREQETATIAAPAQEFGLAEPVAGERVTAKEIPASLASRGAVPDGPEVPGEEDKTSDIDLPTIPVPPVPAGVPGSVPRTIAGMGVLPPALPPPLPRRVSSPPLPTKKA